MKKDSIEKSYDIEWPGWSLDNNNFGEEFDAEARIRMIETGRKLLPYVLEYANHSSKQYLEIGPFFTPLLFSDEAINTLPKDRKVSFLENDQNVISWLTEKFDCNILNLDINAITFPQDLKQKMTSQFGAHENFYDVITVSQIVNYIDYKLLLANIYSSLKTGGQIFINNVIDYGIPVLFSEKRPKSNQEIINTAIALGYKVLLQEELAKTFNKEPHHRLILILTK
ncbi:hypothetical protein [Flavobacterium sp. CLA17]|uniref:hypothetical protein n=1 Tax=Flavobacterium sp. CLA17 TaxID=2724135 RepID=UPI001491BB63|nr:hypothetical protein [Flavobacterium sp. CLA17]QSB29038.1 hypothetical protein HAV12_009965 [Flavobacterium sp. CLA17]